MAFTTGPRETHHPRLPLCPTGCTDALMAVGHGSAAALVGVTLASLNIATPAWRAVKFLDLPLSQCGLSPGPPPHPGPP